MSQHREEKQSNEEEWGEDDEEMVVLAFGDNGDGQIGVGHVAPPYNPLATPAPVRHPRDVLAFRGQRVSHVACGGAHTLVAIGGGGGDCSLYSFGLNSSGQLGLARGRIDAYTPPTNVYAPIAVPASRGQRVLHLACGNDFSLVVLEPVAAAAAEEEEEEEKAAGGGGGGGGGAGVWGAASPAVGGGGTLYAFGSNSDGQLGIGEVVPFLRTPVRVLGLEGQAVRQLAAGGGHVLAVTSCVDPADEHVAAARRRALAALKKEQRLRQKKEAEEQKDNGGGGGAPQRRAAKLDADAERAARSSLYAWGWNAFGQLGLGACRAEEQRISLPRRVEGEHHSLCHTRVAAIACGFAHSLVATAEPSRERRTGAERGWDPLFEAGFSNPAGRVCWGPLAPQRRTLFGFGRNNHGQLGAGYVTTAGEFGGLAFPTPIPSLSSRGALTPAEQLLRDPSEPPDLNIVVLQLACGVEHSLALVERDLTQAEADAAEEEAREWLNEEKRIATAGTAGLRRAAEAAASGDDEDGKDEKEGGEENREPGPPMFWDEPDPPTRGAKQRAYAAEQRQKDKEHAAQVRADRPKARVREVRAFGRNVLGQCGVCAPEPRVATRWAKADSAHLAIVTPAPLYGLEREEITQVCAGYYHSLCASAVGGAFQWGKNNNTAYGTGLGRSFKNITLAPQRLMLRGGDDGREAAVPLRLPGWRLALLCGSSYHFALFEPDEETVTAGPLPWTNEGGFGWVDANADEAQTPAAADGKQGGFGRGGHGGRSEAKHGGSSSGGSSSSDDDGDGEGEEGDEDEDPWEGFEGIDLDRMTALEELGGGTWGEVRRCALPAARDTSMDGMSAFAQAQARARLMATGGAAATAAATAAPLEVAAKHLSGAAFELPLAHYYDAEVALGEHYDPDFPECYDPNDPYAAMQAQRVRPKAIAGRMRAVATKLMEALGELAAKFPEHEGVRREVEEAQAAVGGERRAREAAEAAAAGGIDHGGAGIDLSPEELRKQMYEWDEEAVDMSLTEKEAARAAAMAKAAASLGAMDLEPPSSRLVYYRPPYVAVGFGTAATLELPRLAVLSEVLPKGNLRRSMDLLATPEQLTLGMRFTLLWDVARGMRALHEHGDGPLVHGHLRTSNVLVQATRGAGGVSVWRAKVGEWLLEGALRETTGLRAEADPRDMGFGRQLAYTAPELFEESKVYQAQLVRSAELEKQKAEVAARAEAANAAAGEAKKAAGEGEGEAAAGHGGGSGQDGEGAAHDPLAPKIDPFDQRIREATQDWRCGTLSRQQYDQVLSAIELEREAGRWAAATEPEAGVPSTFSDVYSYGVVVWETITQRMPWSNEVSGAFPLKRIMYKLVEHNGRLPMDDSTRDYMGRPLPRFFVQLMKRCFETEPTDRPNFREICQMFKVIGRYVDESGADMR